MSHEVQPRAIDGSPINFNETPIVRPDLVRGTLGSSTRKPTRYFYFLEPGPTGDRVWEVDGYRVTDPVTSREDWSLLLVCPRCGNHLKLDTTKKPVNITSRGVETGEPIHCTWYQADAAERAGRFGACGWTVELQLTKGELIVPTQTTMGQVIRVRIDAIIKQA